MSVKRSRTFASLLKGHRNAAGLTQEELAGRAGVGVRTISNLEPGTNMAPYRATVRRLADALGLSGGDPLLRHAHDPWIPGRISVASRPKSPWPNEHDERARLRESFTGEVICVGG